MIASGTAEHPYERRSHVSSEVAAQNDKAESAIHDHLHSLILQSVDVEDFLDGLANYSAQSLSTPGGKVLCGVTVLRDRKAATVASSSVQAGRMDEIQYSFGDGPCMTASRVQATIYVPSVAEDSRWPEYLAVIAEHGIRSILAVPFNLEGDAKAALNLYSEKAATFDAHAIDLAESYTRQASQALRLGLRFAQHIDTASNLRSAMESRTVIDLAVGIIMAQNRCSQERAFGILSSASSTRHMKVRDVASTLVASIGQEAPNTHYEN